jgi:CRISPR/Cas system-associated endonuclease Cas1
MFDLVSVELATLLESHGLDASLGVYQSLAYVRQSLALDIVEELAVLVDQWILLFCIRMKKLLLFEFLKRVFV